MPCLKHINMKLPERWDAAGSVEQDVWQGFVCHRWSKRYCLLHGDYLYICKSDSTDADCYDLNTSDVKISYSTKKKYGKNVIADQKGTVEVRDRESGRKLRFRVTGNSEIDYWKYHLCGEKGKKADSGPTDPVEVSPFVGKGKLSDETVDYVGSDSATDKWKLLYNRQAAQISKPSTSSVLEYSPLTSSVSASCLECCAPEEISECETDKEIQQTQASEDSIRSPSILESQYVKNDKSADPKETWLWWWERIEDQLEFVEPKPSIFVSRSAEKTSLPVQNPVPAQSPKATEETKLTRSRSWKEKSKNFNQGRGMYGLKQDWQPWEKTKGTVQFSNTSPSPLVKPARKGSLKIPVCFISDLVQSPAEEPITSGVRITESLDDQNHQKLQSEMIDESQNLVFEESSDRQSMDGERNVTSEQRILDNFITAMGPIPFRKQGSFESKNL